MTLCVMHAFHRVIDTYCHLAVTCTHGIGVKGCYVTVTAWEDGGVVGWAVDGGVETVAGVVVIVIECYHM